MIRKLEVIMSLVIAVVSLLFLGGYALTMTQISQAQFEASLYPKLGEAIVAKGPTLAYTELKTFAVWLGVTLVLTLLGLVVSSYLIGNNRRPKLAAVGYFITGGILLVGSQLLAYPLAFFCFVLAGLAVIRKEASTLKSPLKKA